MPRLAASAYTTVFHYLEIDGVCLLWRASSEQMETLLPRFDAMASVAETTG